jgi:hypothetical protein
VSPDNVETGDGHDERRGEAEGEDRDRFGAEQSRASCRPGQQVPQRAQPRFTGDGVAGHDRHRQRQEHRERDRHGGQCCEDAVVGDLIEEGRSPAAARAT